MSRWFDSVIFDLDGTLIDSAPGILQGFIAAFASCGITPRRPWSIALIGPPLLQTIAQQCDSKDPALLDRLVVAFKDYYDSEGFRLSTPYSGVHRLLKRLRDEKIRIFIATNKRIVPTLRILRHLDWNELFEGVFSVDSLELPQTSKTDVICHITQHFGLQQERSLYLGDRYEDYEAATSAGLPFALATWGFGDADADALVPQMCMRMLKAESVSHLVCDQGALCPNIQSHSCTNVLLTNVLK